MRLYKGFVHLGVLALVVVTLSVVASVTLLAQTPIDNRPIGRICDKYPTLPICKRVSPTPTPVIDSDNDGFSDVVENYLGTNPKNACGPEAWPPDFNDDKTVNIIDSGAIRPHFNSQIGQVNYDPRFDLNADGKINIIDTEVLKFYFGKSCVLPTPTRIPTSNPSPSSTPTATPSPVPISDPRISKITPPNVGPYSGDIRITGTNFGSSKGRVHFTQDGVIVGGSMIRSWSNSAIIACNISVPSPNRLYGVKVETADGRASTDFPYYVGPSQSIGTPLPCNF